MDYAKFQEIRVLMIHVHCKVLKNSKLITDEKVSQDISNESKFEFVWEQNVLQLLKLCGNQPPILQHSVDFIFFQLTNYSIKKFFETSVIRSHTKQNGIKRNIYFFQYKKENLILNINFRMRNLEISSLFKVNV